MPVTMIALLWSADGAAASGGADWLALADASCAKAGVATARASALDPVAASNPRRACRTKEELSEKPVINPSLYILRPDARPDKSDVLGALSTQRALTQS